MPSHRINGNAGDVRIHVSVARVHIHSTGVENGVLHLADALFALFAVLVAREGAGAHNQVVFERSGNIQGFGNAREAQLAQLAFGRDHVHARPH